MACVMAHMPMLWFSVCYCIQLYVNPPSIIVHISCTQKGYDIALKKVLQSIICHDSGHIGGNR